MRAAVFITLGPVFAWMSAAIISLTANYFYGHFYHFDNRAMITILSGFYRKSRFFEMLLPFFMYGIFVSSITYFILKKFKMLINIKYLIPSALIGAIVSILIIGSAIYWTDLNNTVVSIGALQPGYYKFLLFQGIIGFFGTIPVWFLAHKMTKKPEH